MILNLNTVPALAWTPLEFFSPVWEWGTPVKQQLLAMDTGSSVTWVTCIGSAFQAGDYSYLKSTTCTLVTCADPGCVPYGTLCVHQAAECPFTLKYFSSVASVDGIFVKDTITFSENLSVPSMMFGCGFPKAPIKEDFSGTGVMGLTNHPLSMASQFGSVFSYCIGNMHDPSYGFNTLILNDGLLLGNSTPILNILSKIYVNLQSITVRGEVLDINPIIFDRDITHGGSGTIMDSGSPKTLLADVAYNALRDKLKQIMAPVSAEAMCFYNLQPSQVPEVEFIFEQGAKLSLGMGALFSPGESSPRVQCFNGVKPTSGMSGVLGNVTLIGINAQQFHNIGYDYNAGKMYISMV
uniref:Peptidase A1 domain-containing protein n=1 Tax=Kalanchoe fedtschenkoi TaxID=63787 RepID=A0A7N1A9B6_KALFE